MIDTVPVEDRFADIKTATVTHLKQHGCECYPYADGSLLATLAAAVHADTVVELGTALGYTTAWLASTGAHVHTIDQDQGHVRHAHLHLVHHKLADRVSFHTGDAADILPTLAVTAGTANADVAFFDGYAPTLGLIEALAAVLRPGGLLIVGNMTLGRHTRMIRAHLADWTHSDLGETLLAVNPR